MKWFKHFSNAHTDTKIRRLIRKYGLRGYGLYFACVEMISFQLSPESAMPELEDSARDIAELFGEDTAMIEEILNFCIYDQKLFELNDETGRLVCMKLLTHLDNTLSNNPEIKKILNNFNKLQETSSNLKQIRLDKIRLDEIRKEKEGSTKKRFKKPTLEEVADYVKEKSFDVDPEAFINRYKTVGWVVGTAKTPMKDWKAAVRTWQKNEEKWRGQSKKLSPLQARFQKQYGDTWERDLKAVYHRSGGNLIDFMQNKKLQERRDTFDEWFSACEDIFTGGDK